MGFWKKIGDLARSNINSLINQLEDKKKLTELAVMDLEENKKKARAMLLSAKASLQLAEKQKGRLKEKIEDLKHDAEKFLRENDETKAKASLSLKQPLLVELSTCEEEIKVLEKTIATITDGLSGLDNKIDAMRTKANVEQGRATIDDEDAFSVFSRMEEKIENSEHEIEALNELLELEGKKPAAKKMQSDFDKHSDPQALERELAAMKKKLED